jgi:redox-sensitive bicupin YhaK (pirin superfamily)
VRDTATIDEVVDLLDCAGWKGYAKAVRCQADDVRALVAQREALLVALKGVVQVADRRTVEFDAARAAIAEAENAIITQETER